MSLPELSAQSHQRAEALSFPPMTSISGELKAAKIARESSGACQRLRHDASLSGQHTAAPQAAHTNARVCVYDELDPLSTRHAKGLHPWPQACVRLCGVDRQNVRISDMCCYSLL